MNRTFWAPLVVAMFLCVPTDNSHAAGAPANLSQSTLGYTYFQKPGASIESHDVEVKACAAAAANLVAVDDQTNAHGQSEGLVGSFVADAIASPFHHAVVAAGLENCMVVRGWRVVRLPDDQGRRLSALPAPDLREQLSALVGRVDPVSAPARVWANDAADGATDRIESRPHRTVRGQLSLLAATGADVDKLTPTGGALVVTFPAVWIKSGKPQDLASLAPTNGAIIVVLKGVSLSTVNQLVFQKMPDKDETSPAAPPAFAPAQYIFTAKKEGNTFAAQVPAGRWRLAAMSIAGFTLDFCLGAPAFEVPAGKIVYAGRFDFAAADMGPDLALAPAQTWLAKSGVQSDLVPAGYMNGTTGVCLSNEMYAIEVSGAPFEPTYHWGSQARLLAAPSSAPSGTTP